MFIAKVICCALLLITPALIIRSGLLSARSASSFGASHGYRSNTSLSSPEAWTIAQKLVSVRYPIIGILLAMASLGFLLAMPITNTLTLAIIWAIAFGFEIVILLSAMVSVEISLQNQLSKASA